MGLIDDARRDMAWLVANENHPQMNLILDDGPTRLDALRSAMAAMDKAKDIENE